MSRYVMPRQGAKGQNLTPTNGAKLYFYATGTSTPQNTYSDDALTTPNANPVVADSKGLFPAIFLSPTVTYKVQLKDKNDVQYWEEDPVRPYIDNNEDFIAYNVDHISALKALDSTVLIDNIISYVKGYYTVGDGGGGQFYWDASSSESDNGGTVILPTGHMGSGRWVKITKGIITTKDFGCFGDGVSDDTTNFQSALDYIAISKDKLIGIPGETYLHSMLLIKNGTTEIDLSMSTLKPDGTTDPDNITTEASIVLSRS